MTKSKNTKKALLASIISMLLCFSMLIGSTFAWFTDNATTNVNKIQAGTLDIQLLDAENKNANSLEGQTLTFAKADEAPESEQVLFEPGAKYRLQQAWLYNAGNLHAKYQVVISGIDGNAKLAEVIDVYVNGVNIGTLMNLIINTNGIVKTSTIAPGAFDTFGTIELKMQETAGNEYQGLSIDGIAITVQATQATAEWDSFDNQYDKDATYSDSEKIVAGVATLLHAGNTTVTIPAGTLEEGTVVKVKVENTEAPETVVTIDDTVISAKNISIVDAEGKEISMPDGIYSVTMDIGKDLDATKLALYHKATKVEPINYNATTGIVSFTTDSFSPFTVIYEGIGTIDSAEKLVALSESKKNGDTKTDVVYYLTENIDLSGVEWTAINNFVGTFDGQGHTISNMSANLFGTVSGTVKNLNVDNVTVVNTVKNGANGFIGTVENGLVENCKVSNVDIQWLDTVSDTVDCYGGVISRINGGTVKGCEFNNINVTSYGKMKRFGGAFGEVGGNILDCTINGLTLIVTDNYSGDAYLQQAGGIIGDAYAAAVISGCKFNDIVVTVDEGFNAAGIVGKAFGGAIFEDVTVNKLTMTVGSIIQTQWGTVQNVGGFIGQVDTRANEPRLTMTNCHINELDMIVASSKKGEDPSAGFIASLNGGADITNCTVDGKIDGTNEPIGIGGFLGTIGGYGAPATGYTVNITDCSAEVTITGNDNIFVGGFVGHAGSYNQTMTLELNFKNCEAKGSFYGKLDSNETCTFTGCKVDGADFAG